MGLADWFSTFCANIQIQNGDTIANDAHQRERALWQRLRTDIERSAHELMK